MTHCCSDSPSPDCNQTSSTCSSYIFHIFYKKTQESCFVVFVCQWFSFFDCLSVYIGWVQSISHTLQYKIWVLVVAVVEGPENDWADFLIKRPLQAGSQVFPKLSLCLFVCLFLCLCTFDAGATMISWVTGAILWYFHWTNNSVIR